MSTISGALQRRKAHRYRMQSRAHEHTAAFFSGGTGFKNCTVVARRIESDGSAILASPDSLKLG